MRPLRVGMAPVTRPAPGAIMNASRPPNSSAVPTRRKLGNSLVSRMNRGGPRAVSFLPAIRPHLDSFPNLLTLQPRHLNERNEPLPFRDEKSLRACGRRVATRLEPRSLHHGCEVGLLHDR